MSKIVGEAPPSEIRSWSDEISEIMDVAVKKAIEENRRLGITSGSSVDSESENLPSATIKVEESPD